MKALCKPHFRTIFLAASLSLLPWSVARSDSANRAADQVYLLDSNYEAIQFRSDVIRGNEPIVSAYLMGEDQIGLNQLALLRKAAREGRKPKLLLDAIGQIRVKPKSPNQISRQMIEYLMREGVEVRFYNPATIRNVLTLTVDRRMHDKTVSNADDEAITGGRNPKDAYFGLHKDDLQVDTDLYVRGHSAKAARDYQLKLFYGPDTKVPTRIQLSKQDLADVTKSLDFHETYFEKIGLADLSNRKTNSKPIIAAEAEFVSDHWEAGKFVDDYWVPRRKVGTTESILAKIANAKKEIIIDAQYPFLSDRIADALEAAASRRPPVKIQIVTNGSLADGAAGEGTVRHAGTMALDRYRRAGFEIREYQGPGKIHSKALTIDNEYSFISSHNLDPRSDALNLEAGVWVKSKKIAEQMRQKILSRLMTSDLVIKDGNLVREPDCLNLFQKLKVNVLKNRL